MPAADRLQQVFRRLTPPADPDADLLARFAAGRDEAAFAALVARHGPMVLAACRRVLGHHDAEDACQAAFLVLARRAGTVRIRGSVAAWLHGVARRAALAARRAAHRRRVHEARVVPPGPDPAPDHDLGELRAVLDREIARLPDKYRAVLVLADLEGRDRREVAADLGLPVGTVASRHARARALLAARLRRRGWGPAVVLAAAPVALPEALARRAVALAVRGRTAGAALTQPELLAREVIRPWRERSWPSRRSDWRWSWWPSGGRGTARRRPAPPRTRSTRRTGRPSWWTRPPAGRGCSSSLPARSRPGCR